MVEHPVPFVSNTEDDTHCFQAALSMVLKYFNPEMNYTFQELERITAKPKDKWTWQSAAILWLHENKYSVVAMDLFGYQRFAREGESYLLEVFGSEVTQAQVDNSDIEQERHFAEQLSTSNLVTMREPVLEDIYRLLADGYVIICSINSMKLSGKEGYAGHSVVLTGYTDESVILHDPGVPARASVHVACDVFESAWAYPNSGAKDLLAINRVDN